MDKSLFWDCTNAEYHGSLEEDSHSSVDLFRESVEQYAFRRVFRTVSAPAPTEEMLFGTLFHTVVLEPWRIDEEYIPYEKHDRRTKKGKEGYADFMQRARGKTFLEEKDLAMAQAMREGVMRNLEARRIIEASGFTEATIRLVDSDSGLPIKVRMDKLNNDGLIGDLKTTWKVDPDSWSRTMHNFGYHRQGAMYIDAAKQRLGVDGPFILMACSKTPPHECVCYKPGFNSLNLGRSENRSAMFELAYRRRENNWTGRYSGRINDIDVPAYALRGN